jgi:4-amino-4-deoxy-L-arabinose transferase-like glycosyltransferase
MRASAKGWISRRDPYMITRLWRSPSDQPRWTRPVLLAIAALAGVAYGWGMNGAVLEAFYGAAARSMSTSWHDFLFGAVDPMGTVTVDKLPGALWPQALLLRIFGFHTWVVVLPQVLEGVATILVLFHLMRLLAGPVAGITAAAVLASSPVTVALNRGNVSDSLLILLTVLAADATVSAAIGGRLRSLLLAGVWIGLAFQAKMLQAWLILPALALAYLFAAPSPLRERARHLALAGLVTVAVSLSWMAVVSLVPASHRPYFDGTQNNSVFSQVFDYNGIARLGHGSSVAGVGHRAAFLTRQSKSQTAGNLAEHVRPSWHRLLSGLYGRDVGWLLPLALISAAGVALMRRKRKPRDRQLTSMLLWGTWLLMLGVFFSDGIYLHSYYVAALAPAIAALCGTGVAAAWPHRSQPAARRMLAGLLIASTAYGLYLLRGASEVPGWLIPTAAALTALTALWSLSTGRHGSTNDRGDRALLAASATCLLLLPLVTSVLMVTRGLGPFAAPYEPAVATETRSEAKRESALSAHIVELISSTYEAPIAFAIQTSQLAAPYILATGREILPIGGFEGGIPSPTVGQVAHYVSSGELRAVLVPDSSSDPRLVWVYSHCKRTEGTTGGSVPLRLYDCEAS